MLTSDLRREKKTRQQKIVIYVKYTWQLHGCSRQLWGSFITRKRGKQDDMSSRCHRATVCGRRASRIQVGGGGKTTLCAFGFCHSCSWTGGFGPGWNNACVFLLWEWVNIWGHCTNSHVVNCMSKVLKRVVQMLMFCNYFYFFYRSCKIEIFFLTFRVKQRNLMEILIKRTPDLPSHKMTDIKGITLTIVEHSK